jgi:1-acyl-sn-glycerol-3-phosphate acyltransferase
LQKTRGSILQGVVTISLLTANVLFWSVPLMFVALLKALVPIAAWRRLTSRWMIRLAEFWISTNNAIFGLTKALQLDVRGAQELRPEEWYLVIANHQSWVDILVLQAAFNHRIPFLKFFLKQQLIWVPVLGLCWWALDFPFMRRHSAEYLAKHPEMRGKDLAATRKACEKFREIPTSVMNFVEGTRFTEEKRLRTKSPYRHLLAPKAGGAAYVLSAMGGTLRAMLDVTIAYRKGIPTLWDLCCGHLEQPVIVDVRRREIDQWTAAGDYTEDRGFKKRFRSSLDNIWAEKDARLDELLRG